MLDAAKVDERDGTQDEGLRALQEEARRGVTDGDVIMAFVTLVLVDHREQQFAAMMAMLEDSLDLLVERGDLAIAADAADALRAAAENPALSEEQRRRVEASLGRLTKPEDIRTMAHALRIYHTGSDENQAARRLLTSLGPLAIDPLLEQLAEEQDMAVRKSLVELLSEMAPSYLSEVGAHVSDARWYVVRNVVSILASTHSSAMLPYLERTLRHHEVRVRRETIRALSGVNDRVAHAMLVHALTDEDAQNVQLAARYLGTAKVASAIPSLEQVARGDGRGNREVAPRVEAIEALGKLGATQALPTLEGLAGRRTIIGAGKTRELAAAADAAIHRIRSCGRGCVMAEPVDPMQPRARRSARYRHSRVLGDALLQRAAAAHARHAHPALRCSARRVPLPVQPPRRTGVGDRAVQRGDRRTTPKAWTWNSASSKARS